MTISATLDAQLSGNDVSVHVTAQIGNLGSVASTVAGLLEHPPAGISDLLDRLKTFPLPDIALGGDLQGLLGSLASAVPADLSSVTTDLVQRLRDLQGMVGGDLAVAIENGLAPILDLAKLTQIDFTCARGGGAGGATAPGATGPGATGPGAPGPGAGPPPSGAPPSGPGAPPPTPATGAGPGPAAVVDQIGSALDTFPTPFTLDAFLGWLLAITTFPGREQVLPVPVPVFDDVHDALETALAWKAMSPAEIAADLAGSLGALDTFVRASVDGAFGSLSADLAALVPPLQASTLPTLAGGIAARLAELAAAVGTGDVSGTGPAVTALNTLLAQYEAARTSLGTDVLSRLPAVAGRLHDLPVALDDALSRIVSVLVEDGALPITLPTEATPPLPAGVVSEINKLIEPIVAWFEGVARALDLSAAAGPIGTVAGALKSAVDGLDAAVGDVTTQVQHLLAQAGSLLDSIDLKALTDQVKAAIDAFKTQLVTQLNQLFAPVRTVVSTVVSAIDDGVDAFHPQDLIDALKSVLDTIVGVLDDPSFAGPVHDIRAAIDDATQALKALSFAPVTDPVVAEIGQITTVLQALDTSVLSPALQLALQAALLILPGDLDFAIDPLEADFDAAVDAGPGALVGAVKEPVRQLLEQVRRFEPASLIGDALSKPFNDLVAQMQAFTPSKLLEPVDRELAALKARLSHEASPGRLLEPLQPAFDQVLAAFDRLRPDDLVKPLNDLLAKLVDDVLKAVPAEELLASVGGVLATVTEVATFGTKVVGVIHKVHDLLAGLADAPAQLDAWAASVVTGVASLADASPVQAALGQTESSLAATKAAPLGARFDAAVNPVTAALDAFDPAARLAAIVQAFREVSGPALAALPPSPQKAALRQALDRASPLQPAFGAPFEALRAFRDQISAAHDALHAELDDWDARYHQGDGVLACLATTSITTAELSTWVGDAIAGHVVRPLRAVLMLAGPAAAFAQLVVTQLDALVTAVTGQLAALVSGPGSLGAIKAALDQLVARFRHLNLDFLADSLRELFEHMRAKLEALNPSALRGMVDNAFAEMLATLDVHQVIPAADVKKLDDDYTAVITKLQALDPEKLVVDVVQPKFEQAVRPLIEAFDISADIDTVLGVLAGLKTDLHTDLEKVNEAYKAMLAAAPSINPLSIAIDIDVDVGSLF
jgi:hypothetical protein